MSEGLRPTATRDPSIFLYGLHSALLLIDGIGQEELAGVYDPRPARRNMLRELGDPFEDTSRSLRLTLGSDCRWLDPSVYEDLVKLSAYPNVTVDLTPGLPSMGYAHAHTATARFNRDAAIDHVVVTSPRSPGRLSSGVLMGGGHGALKNVLRLSEAEARRVALDVAVHEALGNDYLVSGIGIRAREHRRAVWPNTIGFCSVSEAFGLAGVKARMYSFVPLEVYPADSMVSVNVGRWRDQAAMWSAWGVRRALAGALSPDSTPEERASQSHLLAMRSLLVDALVARDAVYALTRRDAGPRENRRPFDEPSPGARGNDLLQLLRYHTVSMLDHVFALTDNLAWVAVRMTGTRIDREHEVGLGALVGPRKKRWAREGQLSDVSAKLEALGELPYVLAMRRLRNVSVHREGVPYGAVDFDPRPAPPLERVFALWLIEDWDEVVVREVGARADLAEDGIVVLTFLRLVDELWASATSFLNEALGLFIWTSSDWLRADAEYRERARLDRAWRHPRQPLLFRFGGGASRTSAERPAETRT